MNRIRNEQGHIITDIREIQDIKRECFKDMYSITLEKKMDTFLDLSKLPKLNQESNNINRPMTHDREGDGKDRANCTQLSSDSHVCPMACVMSPESYTQTIIINN